VPTSRDLIKLSNSFAGYAKRIRKSGIKDEKQAELYDLASRVAMKRAKQLARGKLRTPIPVPELSDAVAPLTSSFKT
jgi:hypothetical protein